MSASSIVATFTCSKDIVHANLASAPEKLSAAGEAMRQELVGVLGPDAGAGVTLASITIS